MSSLSVGSIRKTPFAGRLVLSGLAVAMFLATALIRVAPARAFEAWCADDPVVSINGQLVDIQVQVPVTRLLAQRATTLTVIIPSNVSGFVVVDDVSAFPMKTTVSPTGPAWSGRGAVPVKVVANVQATASYQIKLTGTPILSLSNPLALVTPAATTGVTNSSVNLSFALGR